MAKTNKESNQDKKVQNGFDADTKGYTQRMGLNQKQMSSMAQRFLRNEQLVGLTSIGFGAILLLNAVGFFPLFNYLLGAISIALLVYGAWKINLVRRTQNIIDWFQNYLDSKSSTKK